MFLLHNPFASNRLSSLRVSSRGTFTLQQPQLRNFSTARKKVLPRTTRNCFDRYRVRERLHLQTARAVDPEERQRVHTLWHFHGFVVLAILD